MADVGDLKSSGLITRAGSTPASGTKVMQQATLIQCRLLHC